VRALSSLSQALGSRTNPSIGFSSAMRFSTLEELLRSDKESRRQAMQAGAVVFLDKPFSDEQLLKNIRSAFGLMAIEAMGDNVGRRTISLCHGQATNR